MRNRTDIVIKPADKRGAVVVWDWNLYLEEATKQLSDTHFYQQIGRDVTETHQKEIFSVVTQAIATGDLPPKMKNLNVDHPRTSIFYMLLKIQKPGNHGRPIVSACNRPTSNISAYLDSLMAPLVKQRPTYAKDSSHALQILESFSFTGSHRNLFTMEIRSLYTVIPNNDGLQALKYNLDLRPEQQPPANTLVRLAELVLNLNCFDFDGNYYQQVRGVAMGNGARLCMPVCWLRRENQEYQGRKPDLYKRYIDDFLGASSDTRQDL